ncbi:MAG: TlpA family protein disulfide reductase [Gammaproteobacteria bacterium]|nr:TlpA family protein disulfide reductase [Gammaproteobacteria bacterium]
MPTPYCSKPTSRRTTKPIKPCCGASKSLAHRPSPCGSAESTPAKVIPELLPDFTLATLEGPPRALSSFDHPSLIVNFWATWCAPCRREIPLLRQLRTERGARGVEVVGVAVDFREDVLKYARDIGLDYPLLIGEEDGVAAADLFGVSTAFPFTIFADAQRRIVAVKIGELHADEAAFILDHVEKLNSGQLTIEAARPLIRDEIKRLDALRSAGEKS